MQIQPSGIRKFFDIVSEMKDAISLGVGEPDFDTPWHIREEGIYSFLDIIMQNSIHDKAYLSLCALTSEEL